jgi:hypothetical protein
MMHAGKAGAFFSLLAAAVLFSGCQTRGGGNSAAAAVATTSAVVIGGTLSPVGSAVRAVHGPTRHLAEPSLYELTPGQVVVTNHVGWFTDRSEIVPRGNSRSFSAWVLDVSQVGDSCALVLTPDNLVRWFWREHTIDQLKPILRRTPDRAAASDAFEWDAKRRAVTLHYAGHTHRITLIQGHLP